MLSSIGSYDFLTMHSCPAPKSEGLVVESQAGKANVAIFTTGERGKEQEITTEVDVATWAAAVALAQAYPALKAAASVNVTYGGQLLVDKYKVLDVTATPERVIGHGGLSGAAEAVVKAQWKLIAV